MLTQTPVAEVPQHPPGTCLLHGLSFSSGLADKAHRGWDLVAGDKPREGVVARGRPRDRMCLGKSRVTQVPCDLLLSHDGSLKAWAEAQRGFPPRKCFSDRVLGRTSGKD